MALLTSNVGGLLQGTGSIQGGSISQPIGVKAQSPSNNISTQAPTLSSNQIAPTDLSSTYANVGGTIYNKQSQTKFSNPTDFFKDSGQSSFNNLKFDTNYTPTGKETIYGQTPTPTQTATQNTNQNNYVPANQPTPAPAQATPNQPSTPYIPPNQGTTGVSQGGIIGNLINTANNQSPAVQKAIQDIQNLQTSEAQSEANISSEPIDLSLASGQTGILQKLAAAKMGAAQTALQNALSEQGQQINATTSAGQLNTPVIANPGQVQISPSQPNPGATTSGAANLSSLIGQRPSVSSLGTTEFYNTQTGQGFSTPQALADFVNQQNPGINATPQNVFQLLQQQGQGGSNLLGLDANTLNTYAQMLASGQGASIPSSVTGNTALMARLYNMAQGLAGGNFNTNVAAGIGAANQSNAQAGNTAAVNAGVSAYNSAYQDYLNVGQSVDTIDSFGQLLLSNAGGINPYDARFANQTLSTIRQQLSGSQQAQFDSTLAALKSKVSGLLSVGGNETPTNLTNDANSIINGSVSLGALQDTLNRIKQEGQSIKNIAAQKANTALGQAQGNPGSGVSISNGQVVNNQWSW